jgi:hypothetical protein
MKPKIIKQSVIFLLLLFFGAGCGKEDLDYDSNSIIGKWEWLYTSGGFAGTTYPKENETVSWEFTEDSIFIRRVNNKTTFQVNFYVSIDTLFWRNDPTDMAYQFFIKSDSLELWDLSSIPPIFFHTFKRSN